MIKLPEGRSVSQPSSSLMKGRSTVSSPAVNAQQNAWKAGSALPDAVGDALYQLEELLRGASEDSKVAAPEEQGEEQDKSLATLAAFYAWLEEVEKEARESAPDASEAALRLLQGQRKQANGVLALIDDALQALEGLSSLHAVVDKQTSTLHHATEALLGEKQQLVTLAQAIHEQLQHFRALDLVTAQFTAGLAVTDPRFLQCLAQLDSSLRFVRFHPNYVDSQRYALRLSSQLARALAMIRDHLVAQWRSLRPREGGSESSLAFVEWRAVAPTLRPYCAELERRAATQAPALLSECHSQLFAIRLALVSPLLKENLGRLSSLPLPKAAAEGASYLASLAALEYQLFHAYFERDPPSLADELLGPLASQWLDWLRPLVISCRDLATLCLVVGALQAVQQDSRRQHNRSGSWGPLLVHLERASATVREKIVFVAQESIAVELQGFRPTARDLEYPARLLDASPPDASNVGASPVTSWYPSLERCVLLLKRLQSALEGSVLDGLAVEAITVTMASLLRASEVIGANVSLIDGQLFLLRHLGILRDTMRSVGVTHAVTERRIDFGALRASIARLGDMKLLSLSRANPLLGVVPDVTTHTLDVRKEVDLVLVHTLDAFVDTALTPSLAALRVPRISSGALASAISALQPRLVETLAAAKQYLPEPRGAFVALQQACTDGIARASEKLEADAGEAGAVQEQLTQLAELRAWMDKTVSQML